MRKFLVFSVDDEFWFTTEEMSDGVLVSEIRAECVLSAKIIFANDLIKRGERVKVQSLRP